jgi:hypothetical protein
LVSYGRELRHGSRLFKNRGQPSISFSSFGMCSAHRWIRINNNWERSMLEWMDIAIRWCQAQLERYTGGSVSINLSSDRPRPFRVSLNSEIWYNRAVWHLDIFGVSWFRRNSVRPRRVFSIPDKWLLILERRKWNPSILAVAFGPAIDRLGSATRGFGAISRVVVLSIMKESVAESSVLRVSSTCYSGHMFRECRAEVTIKDWMFIPLVWHRWALKCYGQTPGINIETLKFFSKKIALWTA